jgi:hypothetical protein
MSFYKNYDLKQLVSEQDAKTFRAIQNSTGRIVLLHLFDGKEHPILTEIKKKLGGAPGGRAMQPLLEMGEFAGGHYVVTDLIEPFPGLKEWAGRLPDLQVSTGPALLPPGDESRPPDLASVRLPGRSYPAPAPNPVLTDTVSPVRSGDEPGELTQSILDGLNGNGAAGWLKASLSDVSAEFKAFLGIRTGSHNFPEGIRGSGRPPDPAPASRDNAGARDGKMAPGKKIDSAGAVGPPLPGKAALPEPSDFSKSFDVSAGLVPVSLGAIPSNSAIASPEPSGKPGSGNKPVESALSDLTLFGEKFAAGPALAAGTVGLPQRMKLPAPPREAKGKTTVWLAIGIPALLVMLVLVVIMATGRR